MRAWQPFRMLAAHHPHRDIQRSFEASEELETSLRADLDAMPYFRWASEDEIQRSYAAYTSADTDALCREWAAVAEPTRAKMPASMRLAYKASGLGPRLLNATVFLDSVRAALRAGECLREGLRPEVREVLMGEFPYLERRHEHVPAGSPVPFEFPALFGRFLSSGDLDDTRARWQLAVGLNEVQQCCYSQFAAEHFRLPELHRHAARERELARNYFGHWSPRCSLELWRETIYVLDALNAETFALVCTTLLPRMMRPQALRERGANKRRWAEFTAGLDQPQWLIEPD